MAERHSALHDTWQTSAVDGEPGITVRLLRDFSLYQLSHWPDRREAFATALRETLSLAPADAADRAAGDDSRWLLPIGPETYWLVAHDGETLDGPLRERLEHAIGTVSNLGHARTGLRLRGPEVRSVLARGLAIDLHARVFPAGNVAVSAIHGIDLVLHRNDAPGDEVFDLYVPRSYAEEFRHWLSEAAAECGYRID